MLDKAILILEADVSGNVDVYLKKFPKNILDKFEDKLRAGYAKGMKFDFDDEESDIKAFFDLFDPNNPQDVKEWRVSNIKSGREVRQKLIAKEKIAPEPKREDFNSASEYNMALAKWRAEKANIEKSGAKKEKQYDPHGYPKELKTNKATLEKISNYVTQAKNIDITNAYNTKDEAIINSRGNDLLDVAEKIMSTVKLFDLKTDTGSFKKIDKDVYGPYKQMIEAYKKVKEKKDFKTLTNLKRAIVSIKRQGTHTDTDVGLSGTINKHIYGTEAGHSGPISLDSAIGDYKEINSIDTSTPEGIKTLKLKIKDIFSNLGLTAKGGPTGSKMIDPKVKDIVGGIRTPEEQKKFEADKEGTIVDVTKMAPKTHEERAEYMEQLALLKKMYNYVERGFTDIDPEELKKGILKMNEDGINSLLNIKLKMTAEGGKNSKVDEFMRERDLIKKHLEDKKKAGSSAMEAILAKKRAAAAAK